MQYASIDIGTNTCNLSIAGWDIHGIQIFHSDKKPIKLGAEGFPDDKIPASAQQRLMDTLLYYRGIIEKYEVNRQTVLATSAIRNAKNKQEIISRIKNETGFDVQVISGDDESEFIYRGVREAVPLDENPCLLIDIGGGSNEIQIANMEKVHWRVSVDCGIARLLNWFQPSDPVKPGEIKHIKSFLNKELDFLNEVANAYNVDTIIGSSGSFDTFASMYLESLGLIDTYTDTSWYSIPMEHYLSIHQKLITCNRKERLSLPGMEAMRVEMIPLASVFTIFLIDLFSVKYLIRSAYALKEGVIVSMVSDERNSEIRNQ